MENGRVETSYFADAVFVGDSLTEGITTYKRDQFPKSTVFLWERGINPLSFLTGTWQINGNAPSSPLDDLFNTNPKKIYFMLGINAITSGQEDDVILKYYEQILDQIKEKFPNAVIYVQSILPIGKEKTLENPESYSKDRIINLNKSLSVMANEKNLNYLNIYEKIADVNGYMQETLVTDGFHMTKEGYERWVDYLITHTKHSKDNPYIIGSPYYFEK